MSKEKKIIVKDLKKWTIHLCMSMGIFFIALYILTFIIDINERQDIFMYSMLFGFSAMIVYWVYTYRIFNKYVSIKEYREINKNISDSILIPQLEKQGFTEKEINEILKNRPVSRYIAREQEILNNKSVEISISSIEDLKQGFIISNKLLTKEGLGIIVDSKSEEIAIIQPNQDIQYIKFSQIHSYNVGQDEIGAGNRAMAFASLTGNDNLYKLGMANTIAGNKTIYSYVIQLILNDVDEPNININILTKKVSSVSSAYAEVNKVGKDITSFLDKIISRNTKVSEPKSDLSKIKELKELLDMGAITQEEYDKKKKELLK